MKFKYYLILFLLIAGFALFTVQDSLAQQTNLRTNHDTLLINFSNKYYITSVNIIPFSEVIRLRNKILKRSEYLFHYGSGYFSLSDSLSYSVFDTLIVTYKSILLNLSKVYRNRELIIRFDSKTGDTLKTANFENRYYSSEYFFGTQLEKSGALIRGFTVGTNKDFTLQSGLRLQLSGKLSDDIEIIAALTDENSPIQPEGNTERLDELDKVFIQIKHQNVSGIFGDYNLVKNIGEFGLINRKLQGLLGEFNFENINGYLGVASAKGKFNTNSFLGQDGVQGPYHLSGSTGERDIIIIAGSEKVFLDGEEMKRGEDKDYLIDYSNSSITFTPNRLITSSSRINLDFEYTDRRFERNLFSIGTSSKLFNDKLNLQFQFLREGDDQDSPIDIVISDSDKAILSKAGDDRIKAIKSGVTFAPADSLGNVKGIYEKRDTILNNQTLEYYFYNPGGLNSFYNVSFSYVGEGKGDYIKQSLGYYTYSGKQNGSYLPIIFLSIPELKQFGNFVIDFAPIQDLRLLLEFAGSSWDKNRLSSLDDENNSGYARTISLKLNPQEIIIGKLNLGKAGIFLKDRFLEERFTSLDRYNSVEFNREYNSSYYSAASKEVLRELGIVYNPLSNLTLNSVYGYLKRGDEFFSSRYNNTLQFTNGKDYNLSYNLDVVNSRNSSITSSWLRQKGAFFYNLYWFKPGMEIQTEKKLDRYKNLDSLLSSSLKYNEINPFIDLKDLYGFNFNFKYTFREDFLPVTGILERESKSFGQTYFLDYGGIAGFNSQIKVTIRDKKYSDIFQKIGQLDNQTILVYSQSRFSLFQRKINGDLFYEVSTQKTSRLEKIFAKVPKGTGNYIYIGDINNNGITDENEFQPTLFDGEFILFTIPTDKLYPVIDLKTSTRWKINLYEFFDSDDYLSIILKTISTETYFRIEENSQEQEIKKIYLLNLSSFQNEKTTLRGNNYFQQDIFLFENNQEVSFRFRFTQRKSLNNFSGGVERGFNSEKSVRLRVKMIQELGNQTDFISQIDNLSASVNSNRNRMVENNNILSDFSYRPDRNIEVGFIIKGGRSIDNYPKNPTIINSNGQIIRFNFSFAGSGRIRIEVERNELNSNTTENYIPFELTGGNVLGKNYFWRVNFDYRIAANLQSTASYDGRLQGSSKVIHTARAEIRAYF